MPEHTISVFDSILQLLFDYQIIQNKTQITDSQTLKKSGASTNVAARGRAIVVQIQDEHTRMATNVPIATTKRKGF